MGKTKHSKPVLQKKDIKNSQLNFLSQNTHLINLIFIGLIVFSVLLFFGNGVFKGKIFVSADNLSPYSFKTFLNDARTSGTFPLWIPYIFMGMPSLAALLTGIASVHNIFGYIWDSVNGLIAGDNLFILTLPYYLLFAVSLYFYVRFKFKNNLIALYSAIAGVFATGIIQLIIVGHHTKMMTISFFPLLLLAFDYLIEKDSLSKIKLLLSFALLTIVLYLQLHFHHVQMLFYSYLFIGIYLIYTLIYRLIKKFKVKNIVICLIVFVLAGLFTLIMDADMILSIREYRNYSMRGQTSIENITNPTIEKSTPLSYEYATNWSFSPGEVLTFLIPYYYGFGNVEIQGQRENTYWGQMPFTDSPVYFGVVTLLLAVIGVVLNFRKNSFVQVLSVIIVLFLFVSFGRTFPLIFDLFFYHFPFFSSFRAPVMIHYYIDFAFVILACYGLKSVIETVKNGITDKKFKTLCYILFGIAGLMFLISIFGFESSYKDAVINGPKAMEYKQQGISVQQISQHFGTVAKIAYENVIKDLRLHSVLLLLVITLAYLYSQKKININLFLAGIIILGAFDIINISAKTLHWDDKTQKDYMFTDTDYSKWILSKEPETYNYRVALLNKGRLATTNILAYYRLHSFNGYHGAKIRIYQDAVDVAGGENPFLLGMCNVKYVISDAPIKDTIGFKEVYRDKNIIYENKFFQPRAFFVDEVKIEPGINILRNFKDANFSPGKTAFLENNIEQNIEKPDSTASARITKFDIHNIEYDVNASGNNFLVLNEIYYPAGWKVYINGTETKFHKTNYLLRGIVVPKGKHLVKFEFHPDTYYKGKSVSTVANIFLVIILIVGVAGYFYENKKNKH